MKIKKLVSRFFAFDVLLLIVAGDSSWSIKKFIWRAYPYVLLLELGIIVFFLLKGFEINDN